jgi:hypothetical protein
MQTLIAELSLPKQRATPPISVRLIYNYSTGLYHTCLYNRQTCSSFSGYYDYKTFEQAFASFQTRCQEWLTYAPSVYELAENLENV